MTIQIDLPRKQDPLILVENSHGIGLIYPTSVNRFGKITLQANEKLLVACPGKENQHNVVIVNKEQVAIGMCNHKNQLQVANTTISPQVLKCKYPITSELRITNQTCANEEGTLIQLGYTVVSIVNRFNLIIIIKTKQFIVDNVFRLSISFLKWHSSFQ